MGSLANVKCWELSTIKSLHSLIGKTFTRLRIDVQNVLGLAFTNDEHELTTKEYCNWSLREEHWRKRETSWTWETKALTVDRT